MKIFPKHITAEFFEYTSDLSVDNIKKEIENLFIESKGFNFSTNLAGKFVSQYEFEITPKWEIGVFSTGILYNPTNLKGYIFKNDKNQTQVNLLVSPNSFFPLLFLLLPVFYLFVFFRIENERRNFNFYLLMISLFIITPIALLLLSNLFKKRLQNRFAEHLNLDKIT